MHVIHVVGARPNFMKVAPVLRALTACPHVRQTLVHTGQHYDVKMSAIFFSQLGIPAPDVNLGVGSSSHAVQTAEIMVRLEEMILANGPDRVLVYGDVNSTVAATLACAKLLIPVDHIEAGLRSWDRAMPEEINRIVTDQLASLLFTPSEDGNMNLKNEGIAASRIHLVGNVMIDTLIRLLPAAQAVWATPTWKRWHDRPYVLVTLHRPSNVDDPAALAQLLTVLQEIGVHTPVIFPVHPRTRGRMEAMGYSCNNDCFSQNLVLMEPLGYVEFLALQQHACAVITDSGGIQEETTYLGVPCLTMRENTERPVTVTLGSNKLIGQDMQMLKSELENILQGRGKRGTIPPLWDGNAGRRIAEILISQ